MGSPCWDHFKKKGGYKAECKHCNDVLSYKNGTTRLNRHYQVTCPVRHPARPGRHGSSHGASVQEGIHNLQNASTFSKSSSKNSGQQTAAAAAEDQLIRMIALHGFPSSLVEDVQFIRFVQMLCPDFKMPSRDDVRKRCDELFDQEMSSLKDALGRTPGLVSLSLGKNSTAYREIAYLAAHFIDDEWNFHSRVIQMFKALPRWGPTLYEDIIHFEDYWVYYWVEESVDYPDNHDALVDIIEHWDLFPKFSGVLLESFSTSRFGKDLYNNNCLPHLSATNNKLLYAAGILWAFDLGDTILDPDDIAVFRYDLLKAFLNENLKKKRRQISSRLQLDHPWTYDKRWWYGYYYGLEIIHSECSSTTAQIAALEGNSMFQEQITELLRSTLGTIYSAIKTLTASNSPTSNLSLIELLKVRRALVSGYNNPSSSRRNDDLEDFLTSVDAGRKELDNLLDESYLCLSIPLVLDPRFKLIRVEKILETVPFPADKISKVGEDFRQLFREYMKQGNEMEHNNHVNQIDVDPSLQEYGSAWQLIDQPGLLQNNTNPQESYDELNAYLQDEKVPMDQEAFDILKWWKDNCDKYPTVARIARDFLAIPTSHMPSPQLMTDISNHLRRYV